MQSKEALSACTPGELDAGPAKRRELFSFVDPCPTRTPPGARHALPLVHQMPYPTDGGKDLRCLCIRCFTGLFFAQKSGSLLGVRCIRARFAVKFRQDLQEKTKGRPKRCGGAVVSRRTGEWGRRREWGRVLPSPKADVRAKFRGEVAKADFPIGNGRAVGLGAGALRQSWEEKRRPADSRKRSCSGRWRRRCRSSSFDCPRSFRKSFSRRAVMALS